MPSYPKSPTERLAAAMSKGEREDLHRLVRQREKVLKSAAKQRSAELIADFENQLGSEYAFDDDAVWTKAEKLAELEIAKANKLIAARCRELGIPDRFAPCIAHHWLDRGENAVKKRRAELRQMASSRIAAIEQKATVEIELQCLKAQEAPVAFTETALPERVRGDQLLRNRRLRVARDLGE